MAAWTSSMRAPSFSSWPVSSPVWFATTAVSAAGWLTLKSGEPVADKSPEFRRLLPADVVVPPLAEIQERVSGAFPQCLRKMADRLEIAARVAEEDVGHRLPRSGICRTESNRDPSISAGLPGPERKARMSYVLIGDMSSRASPTESLPALAEP